MASSYQSPLAFGSVTRRILSALTGVAFFPPIRFIAIASVSWASWLIEP